MYVCMYAGRHLVERLRNTVCSSRERWCLVNVTILQ